MTFKTKLKWILYFMMTVLSPIMLFNGIFSFGANEIYLWYMMHPKSLICAITSFISILILYILAVPTVFSIFQSSEPENLCQIPDTGLHHEIHNIHDHGSDYEKLLLPALTLALKNQSATSDRGKENEKREIPKPFRADVLSNQLRLLNELRKDNLMEDEEFEILRKEIFKTAQHSLILERE